MSPLHESGVNAVLPFPVVFGDFTSDQITIIMTLPEKTRIPVSAARRKLDGGAVGKFAKVRGWIRSHFEALVGENDRDNEDARRLAFLIGNDMTDGAVIKPEWGMGVSTGSTIDSSDVMKIDL